LDGKDSKGQEVLGVGKVKLKKGHDGRNQKPWARLDRIILDWLGGHG
jgi:hypothetical protein